MGKLPGLERNKWIQHLTEEAKKELYGYYHGRMVYQRKKLKKFLERHPSLIYGSCPINENMPFILSQYDRKWHAFNRVLHEWSLFLNPDIRFTSVDTKREIMKIIEEVKHDG